MQPILLRPKKNVVRWTEEEWDALAKLVHAMRRNSPDAIATLANRAQKQFPKDRQRPGILTTVALQPLVERIQKMDRDLLAKAEKCEEYAAKLTFFENVPASREELLVSLPDEEIRQHFLPRLLQMLAPADAVAAFRMEQLLDAMTTGDLAAVVVKRLLIQLERPVHVTVQLPEQRECRSPVVRQKPNGRTKKIVIIGVKGDEPRHLREKLGYLCDLTFIEVEKLRQESVPRNVDHVILWSKFVSHKHREMVFSTTEPRKVSEHFGGIAQLVERVEGICCAVSVG